MVLRCANQRLAKRLIFLRDTLHNGEHTLHTGESGLPQSMKNTHRIVARCSAALKKKLEKAARISGQRESDLVRVAVEIFLAAHTTQDEIFNAVLWARLPARDE